MGLSLCIGILADLRENDLEGYEYYSNQFELLNEYLRRIGLPIHNEPESCEIMGWEMYGYSGLHYLRRLAAHFDLTGNLPEPGDNKSSNDEILNNYYRLSEERYTESSEKLYVSASKYRFKFDHLINHSDCDGFYLPLTFENVLCPEPELELEGGTIGSSIKLLQECKLLSSLLQIPSSVDENSVELWESADAQGKSAVRWQKYGIESFTCVNLISACTKSIENKSAMIFC